VGPDELTGPDAGELLEAALSSAGGQLENWRVTQVDQHSDQTTVAYRATVRWPTGSTDDLLGASALSADDDPPQAPGALTVTNGPHRVCIWRLPDDPELPGLATAMDPARLERALDSFGVGGTDLHTEVVSYRPKQRAVLRITTARRILYAKVLPAAQAPGLHRRHQMLREAGIPVPRSPGRTDEGMVLLESLPGTPLRQRLLTPSADPLQGLPRPDDVITLLDRLPPGVLGLHRRRPWSRRARLYADLIGEYLPDEADRARRLGAAVTSGLRADPPGVEATHGDFYEAQMTVDRAGRIVGLLDVDTLGPGSRADDLACALAHCDALALSSPRHTARADALARSWRPVFEQRVGQDGLRLRTAGVLMSLATGPHRVQRPDWREATGRMLDRIEQVLAGR